MKHFFYFIEKKCFFAAIFAISLFYVPCVNSQDSSGYASTDPGSRTWMDDHETPQPHWVGGGGGIPHKIISRQRTAETAFTGRFSEKVTLEAGEIPNGKQLFLAYSMNPVLVSSELFVTLGVKSSRSGIQLLARVVLPYVPDPQTGRAMTVMVHGGRYSTPDRWQKLRLDGVSTILAQEVSRLRQAGDGADSRLDTRGAYIDYILLNVWAGRGVYDVFIDSLEITPMIAANVQNAQNAADEDSYAARDERKDGVPAVVNDQEMGFASLSPDEDAHGFSRKTEPGGDLDGNIRENSPSNVQNGGSVEIDVNQLRLMVDDVPMFPRAIRYRGESLYFLHEMGFNTVWLSSPPTVGMEADAKRLGMWFVSPPPREEEQAKDGERFQRVLVWDTGRPTAEMDSSQQNFDSRYRSTSEQVEGYRRSLRPSRPLLGVPEDDMRRYSGAYDIVLVGRNPVNSTLGYAMYGNWLQNIKNTVRDGRPIWTAILTQHDEKLIAQWRQVLQHINGCPGRERDVLGISREIPDALPVEQLRLMTYVALGAGVRGILFESTGRLDAKDQETVYRAKILTLINAELSLIEPWLSHGQTYDAIPSDTNYVVGVMFGTSTPRAKILIPMCLEPQAQYVPGVLASRNVQFLVKNIPATYYTWNFTVDGMTPLPNKRVTGGVQFTLDEIPLVSTVLMTQNMNVTASLSQRSRLFGMKMATQMVEIAELRLRYFLQFYGSSPLSADDSVWYDRAKYYLRLADAARHSGDYAEAFLQAQRAIRPIELLEQRLWKQRTAGLASPNDVPTATAFRALDLHRSWMESVQDLRAGVTRLPSGDFEDLEAFKKAGWTLSPNRVEGTVAGVDLTAEAAFIGNFGLQLETRGTSLERSPAFLDSPAIHLVSPEMHLGPPGTIYEIQAWVNVPRRLLGTVDGLKITCTNGGSVLAQRILETRGWQKIQMWRIVTDNNPIRVKIELGGYGKAWIDDLRVMPMVPKM